MIAKEGTKWNGIEDLVGKKIANPADNIPVVYSLIKAGYDPMKDVEWKNYNTNADKMAAVVSGEADYAILAGFQLYPVKTTPGIEIVKYVDELLPAYGCCRMVMRSDFVKENPEVVKDLMKCLIRAEQWYQDNTDEVIKMLVKELNVSEEYVSEFINNPHYKLSADPGKLNIKNTWDTIVKIGLIEDENIDNERIENHINTELYKKALDECMKEHYDEDPEFYDDRIEFFEKNDEGIKF